VYNKYMSSDSDAFSELYKPVGYEQEKTVEEKKEKERVPRFDLKKLLHRLDAEKMGLVPIVLLLLLLLDVDDEEKFIIIALAFIFGI